MNYSVSKKTTPFSFSCSVYICWPIFISTIFCHTPSKRRPQIEKICKTKVTDLPISLT